MARVTSTRIASLTTDWLNRQGVQVIRLAAREVLADMEAALGIIRRTVGR